MNNTIVRNPDWPALYEAMMGKDKPVLAIAPVKQPEPVVAPKPVSLLAPWEED